MPGHGDCPEPHSEPRHRARRLSHLLRLGAACAPLLLCAAALAQTTAQPAATQDSSGDNVATPAGTLAARPAASVAAAAAAMRKPVSERQAREADDAYIEGAKHIEHDELAAAEKSFARAVALNPGKQEYVLSLAVTREHELTELVQQAAKARLLGDNARADALLAQARAFDPQNRIVTQHLGVDASPLPTKLDARGVPGSGLAATLAGPIEFAPTPGKKDFHERGDPQEVIRAVYQAFGITAVFDPSVTGGKPLQFDLEGVDFEQARRVLDEMTHTFAVAVQPHSALVAKDTQENRDRLATQIEETIYLPGLSSDTMTEMGNLARNVFDIKNVTASLTGGDIVVRGDEPTIRLLNATYADMLDGGSDVLLDVHVYEIDKTHDINIGASLPSSIGGFPIVATAESLVNANQSLINQAVASGLLKLTGTANQQELQELEFLIASGTVNSSQFTDLLGVLGTFGGLPLLGVSLGSTGTFNLLLNSSDVRSLDDVQLRAGNNQDVEFRAGTRYPIVTATYSSGVSSGLASQLAGVTVNGQSASSLLSQYLGSSSVTVPQIQYEDLGVTLKTTPQILRSGDVSLKLDLEIEALGNGTIDSIPILNNRSLTSTVTVPAGKTALLAGLVTRDETRSIEGIPGLSELPGFQGTDKDTEIDSDELLITITPHVVREGRMHIASRVLSFPHVASSF